MNKIDRFHFNSLILNWSRRKFFNAIKQQRRAIKSNVAKADLTGFRNLSGLKLNRRRFEM